MTDSSPSPVRPSGARRKPRWLALPLAALLFFAADAEAQNVALGKPAAQSSTCWEVGGNSGKAAAAVDGNVDTNFWGYSVTHTCGYAPNDWWMVDLGAGTTVGQIRIFNRTDCCSDRLFPFRVAVQDVFNAALTSSNDQFTFDVTAWQANPIDITVPDVSGRYVKVQLLRQETMQLAEVQVFGERLPPVSGVAPEPASMLLLGSGLAGVAGAIRRRRRGEG